MNLVQFLDDYGRITATNMFWYRATAKGGDEPNAFGVPREALLSKVARSEGVFDHAGYTANLTGRVFRALNLANRLRNTDYNMGFRERQLVTTGDKRSPCSYY